MTTNPNPLILPSWPSRSSPAVPSPSLSTTFNSASCMEQLLVDCAHAVDLSDSTHAHQLLWVLNTISSHPHSSSSNTTSDSSDSSPTHRLTSAFLRSLISRASSSSSSSQHYIPLHRFSPTQLVAFVDLTPFHHFGYYSKIIAVINTASLISPISSATLPLSSSSSPSSDPIPTATSLIVIIAVIRSDPDHHQVQSHHPQIPTIPRSRPSPDPDQPPIPTIPRSRPTSDPDHLQNSPPSRAQ